MNNDYYFPLYSGYINANDDIFPSFSGSGTIPQIAQANYEKKLQTKCNTCDGTGKYIGINFEQDCALCQGKGYL